MLVSGRVIPLKRNSKIQRVNWLLLRYPGIPVIQRPVKMTLPQKLVGEIRIRWGGLSLCAFFLGVIFTSDIHVKCLYIYIS